MRFWSPPNCTKMPAAASGPLRFTGAMSTIFPLPVESNLETRNKIAAILKAQNERRSYLEELEKIVALDASAGSARTPRTRSLAAKAPWCWPRRH